MLELQNGHIVCLNSVLALSAIPGAIDYCTSKASAFAFMESLTLGLLDCPGVSATTVLPFHTSTEMFQGMRVRSVHPRDQPPLLSQSRQQPSQKGRRNPLASVSLSALIFHPEATGFYCTMPVPFQAIRKGRLLRFTVRGYRLSW